MNYVSLPVHTQPLVVAGQVQNFSHYFPDATVVLHVSLQARFEVKTLETALRRSRCENVIINPTRVSTAWGSILPAHLANIAYIRKRGDASAICMHASNDMLVRKGVAAYIAGGRNFCHRRIVHPGTLWRFGDAALVDPCLADLRNRLGGVDVIASQIEGSCYEASVLYEIADLIASVPQLPAPIAYPREEVWLSTLAHGLRVRIDGKPYVFSELHRFDRVFWKVMRRVHPLIGRHSATSRFLRRLIEYLMIKSGFHRIDRSWVNSIASGDLKRLLPYQTLSDGNNIWTVFERHGLFGVKRVPRRPNCPLRIYIDSLAAQEALRLTSDSSI